jgi:hypothetical protein
MPIDAVYTFTNGYADQFGGPYWKKFSYKEFEELLLKNGQLLFEAQKKALDEAIENWKGKTQEQVDDICLMGWECNGLRHKKNPARAGFFIQCKLGLCAFHQLNFAVDANFVAYQYTACFQWCIPS